MKIGFIDLETTGLDKVKDRIVEIALVIYDDREKVFERETRINPGIPVGQSFEIHGISDDELKDSPSFQSISKSLLSKIVECDMIAGFGSNYFDLPVLFNEFERSGLYWHYENQMLLDVGNIFKRKEERTLGAASKFYLGKELEGAHGALADTICTADVYFAMIEKYDMPDHEQNAIYSSYDKKIGDINGSFLIGDDGEYYLNFGKYKGELAKEHPDFLQWMLRSNFPSSTNTVCQIILASLYE